MSLIGQCYLCQKPAMVACPLCGRTVCRSCLDHEGRLCKPCLKKMGEHDQDELIT